MSSPYMKKDVGYDAFARRVSFVFVVRVKC